MNVTVLLFSTVSIFLFMSEANVRADEDGNRTESGGSNMETQKLRESWLSSG